MLRVDLLIIKPITPVKQQIGSVAESFHFVRQQLLFIPLAVAVMLLTSLLTPPWVRRSALIVLAGALIFSVLVSFVGSEIKGARRWLSVGGFAVQPSEFIKPGFAALGAQG